MTVLFVVHQFLPGHSAGTEIYTYYLAKELQRRGHRVHVFYTEAYQDRAQYGLRSGEYDGLPFHEAVHNYQFRTFRHSYLDEEMERIFVDVLDEVRPDIVHLQHLHLHSLGYIDLLVDRRLPIVYTLHEYFLMCLNKGQLLRPGLELCEGPEPHECARCAKVFPAVSALDGGSLLEAVERRRQELQSRLDQVDLFVSPSAFLRQRFIDEGMIRADRILHSDNGFNVAPFSDVKRTRSSRLRVGYVGLIGDWKGIHLLVEAFQGLERDDLECKIYGDLEMFPDYRDRLLAMRKPANLEFMGWFDNAEIASVLAEIDILVVPSLWFENSPLTIHEAFLARVPVLTADRGGMAELVEEGKTGLLFELGDASDLRAKILRALEEPGLVQRMQSFPRVKTIAEDADQMERRYRELMAGRIPFA
ncbi:MAG: glycosyltransferase family 4 protein [Planctomycetota bacterium]